MVDTSKKNAIYSLLHKAELDSICKKIDTITVMSSTDPLEKAVKILGDNKILSAPVVDASKEVIGVVDMLDIVSHVISVAPDPLSLSANKLRSLEIAGRAMAFAEVKEIINASGRDPYVPVFSHNPVTQAIELFAKGVHRIPLVDKNLKITHILSQTDVNRFINDKINRGACKPIGILSAKELGLGQQPVKSVNKTDNVLKALNVINKAGVSALAVVDDDGKLVGNFSASDLKGLFKEEFPSFLLTVEEYLTKYSPNSLNPICATSDTTMIQLVKEFVDSRVHRLWVLGDDHKVAGVISLTDIMSVIVNFHLTDATTHKD